MNYSLLSIGTLALIASMLNCSNLCARELLCEQCEPEPDCWEHLFVERSQIFLHGEFLYWTAETSGLDYAVKMNQTVGNATPMATGNYKLAEYNYQPGFRASASYYRCARYWELTAQYTWINPKSTRSTKVTDPEQTGHFLRPTRNLESMGPFLEAKSNIDLNHQMGDLYFARVFDPNPHLRMRLLGGVTIAYFAQDWTMRYKNEGNINEVVKEKWDFFGGGLRAGMIADWFWGCGFYFTARTTIAGLVGSYENKEFQEPNTGGILANAKYGGRKMAFHSQFLLGPSWQQPYDCWSMEIFAGYEFNLWMGLQERIRSARDFPSEPTQTFPSSSLLGLHGLTARLTIGF